MATNPAVSAASGALKLTPLEADVLLGLKGHEPSAPLYARSNSCKRDFALTPVAKLTELSPTAFVAFVGRLVAWLLNVAAAFSGVGPRGPGFRCFPDLC